MAVCIEIQRKEDCCGCGACEAACPKRCITMRFDDEGFEYPFVDGSACVGCGICVKACPVSGDHAKTGAMPVAYAYAATNNDSAIRAVSTSGGVFNVIATAIMEQGGTVIGACFNDSLEVVHDFASTPEEAQRFCGSKYVQSDLMANDVYRRVRTLCKDGLPVLFSGTPCQVQGLLRYLGRSYDNLFTCDFVCHAVPSPYVWRTYLDEIESSRGSRPVYAVFRNKTYGYHSGTMKICFADGSAYYGSGRVDPMHKAFFASLSTRPSCHECQFRSPERASDFTLFDCWSYSRLTGMEDDDLGHSHLWVRSEKGAALLERRAKGLDMVEVSLSDVLATDADMAVRDPERNPNREVFLALCRKKGLDVAIDRFAPVGLGDHLVERCKGFLHRMGVLEALSKAKRSARTKKKEQSLREASAGR